jgi:tetratricopeptide (TPR) repeat protein
MTAWNDLDPADDAAQFFGRRDGRPGAPCPPPELVQASRMGVLPPGLQRVAAHVERCVVCQALDAALGDPSVGELPAVEQDRILERVHAGLKGPSRLSGMTRAWQLAAAAAAIALLLAGTVIVWQSLRKAPAPSAQQAAAEIPPPAPSVFRLQKPTLPSTPSELQLRGSKPEPSDDLAQATELLRRDDFAGAARRLQSLIRRQPRSAAAQFYLGVTELFLQHDHEAVTVLQAAERLADSDDDLRREATWYLALAYHRTGQVEQAKDRLQALCLGQGRRVNQGCAGVRELSGPITLSGVVTGPGGVAVPGAKVAALGLRFNPDFIVSFPTAVSVITDPAGHYSISGVRTQVLQVYKDGYFTTGRVITRITEDTRIDFLLDPWEFISLGDPVRATIQPGDTTCGDADELCHRFALTAPSDGMLEVVLDSASVGTFRPLPQQQSDALRNWDLHLETPEGDAYGPPLGAAFPLRVTIPVHRGATYQIRVLSFADRAREFELRTQLR